MKKKKDNNNNNRSFIQSNIAVVLIKQCESNLIFEEHASSLSFISTKKFVLQGVSFKFKAMKKNFDLLNWNKSLSQWWLLLIIKCELRIMMSMTCWFLSAENYYWNNAIKWIKKFSINILTLISKSAESLNWTVYDGAKYFYSCAITFRASTSNLCEHLIFESFHFLSLIQYWWINQVREANHFSSS